MANRFLERLADGPPLVADGGMGVLVSSAAPRVRIPEEANLRAPETVVKLHVGFIQAGADVIETNTFGANRRSSPPATSRTSCRRSTAPGSSSPARRGRSPAATSSSPARSGRSASRAARHRRTSASEIFAEQAEVLEGRGVDLFAVETFFELEELEAAIGAVRSVSSLPILAMLTFDAGAETLSGLTAKEAAERLRELGVRRDRRQSRRRHPGRARRAERDGRQRPPARGDAEHRPREHGRQSDHLPARLARVLRRVRRARAHPRGSGDRRLLRDDADRDRRHRLGRQGGARAERAARLRRARGHRRRPRAARGDRARPRVPRERVGALGPDRPAARRELRRDDRGRPGAEGLGQGRLRRHQRQRHRPRGGERAHALDRDRAHCGRRDDPAPDDARRHDHGPRVPAPRRARMRHPQRPLRDRRPARGRRLSGLARRLRDRLDRPHRADGAPEPRRGLQRARDRRGDFVLHRRRRQPRRGRPRRGARPLPAARSRPARTSR